MSTGAGCRFTQLETTEWKYELQRWPYGETLDYDEFGPFKTYYEALDHLRANHANPGGFMIRRLDDIHNTCDHDFSGDEDYQSGERECVKCGLGPSTIEYIRMSNGEPY